MNFFNKLFSCCLPRRDEDLYREFNDKEGIKKRKRLIRSM